MTTEAFLDRLRTALHAVDLRDERVNDLVNEVASHLAESEEDPAEAFGSPETLARELTDEHDIEGNWALEPMKVAPRRRERGFTVGWNTTPTYTQRGQWHCGLGVDDVLGQTVQVITARGGKVLERAEGLLTAQLGSRVALRLFGVLMAAGRSRLPMRLDLAVTPGSTGSNIDAVLTEDGGNYAFKLGMTEGPYQQSFDTVFADLLRATQAGR